MKSEHLVGTSIPRFTFDTPTTPGNDFYKLCEGEHPLVMIFLPAFDHPVAREYLTRYLQTLPRLRGVRLACVVRSSPRMVAKATQGAEFPFTLICDAPGVLYGYLGVEQARGILSWSFAAQRIYKAAKEQGYRYNSNAPQQLPLTLILDRDGTVLFCHYGASLTDVPEDCAAIQSLLEEMELTPGLEPEEDELPYEELQTAVAAESRPRSRHGREQPETTDEFRPIRPVHAYPESDLEKTSMFGLFDDPYDDK